VNAGSAPFCDPHAECNVDRYTCEMNARSGYYQPAHLSFCGACQGLLTASQATSRSLGRAAEELARALAGEAVVNGVFERVSMSSAGAEGAGGSLTPSLSADGRYVAFDSVAANLVAGDTNGVRDIFVFDRTLAQVARVSVSTGGTQGNGDSIVAVISGNGRYVAFLSQATNLVAGDTNGQPDVFVHDRQTSQTERVSVGAGGAQATAGSGPFGLGIGSWPSSNYTASVVGNSELAISDDGRYVAFVSDAAMALGPGASTSNLPSVYVRDRQASTTTLVSASTGGSSVTLVVTCEITPINPTCPDTPPSSNALNRPRISMSADGRYVAFDTNLRAESSDTNDRADVYVHDLQTKQTSRVSVSSAGAQGNGYSGWPSISGDGRYVAFASEATTLAPGSAGYQRAIYLRDRQAGTTTRVPHLAGRAVRPAISRDGRRIAYAAFAGFSLPKIEVYDRVSGLTHVASDPNASTFANAGSFGAAINADASVIAFASSATNLVTADNNAADDIFVSVAAVPAITTHPSNISVAPGSPVEFSVQVTGSPNTEFSWQLSNDGGQNWQTLPTTSSSLSFAAILSANGFKYRCIVHNWAGTVTSNAATLTVTTNAPAITQQPVNMSIPPGTSAFFNVSATGTPPLAYRWQLSSNAGVSWTDVGNAAPYSGVTSFQLLITTPSANLSGTRYRVIVTNTAGTATSNAATLTVAGPPPPPALFADRTSLTFGATTNGAAFVAQTAAQIVRLTQSGAGSPAWTATPNQSWLQVSPASGTGSATLSVSVKAGGLPASGTIPATITFATTGSATTPAAINVTLQLTPSTAAKVPFGTIDTPTDHRTGVTGAVPFTGWVLDDVEVKRVMICRDAVGVEVAPIDPNCAGAAQIFVGFGVFIDGARSDVAAAYPGFPLNTRAGWGFMVLTNMLPNQGNGTYRFTAWAEDLEGRVFQLGTRTMTCANANATLPFGSIDTPTQGGLASGTNFVNFGWVLTPLPKTVPLNGSTIQVMVDGVSVGTVDYNHPRSDIQAFFPGYNNTNGAIGFRIIDTTTLANGLHTISWTVADNQGAVEGIGSRFFTVSNGVSSATAASTRVEASATATTSATHGDVDALTIDTPPVVTRRGWDLNAPYQGVQPSTAGQFVIRAEEVNRVEVLLASRLEAVATSPTRYTGYLRTGATLAPLPVGSNLDPITGTFTWAPGLGFVGAYDFVFVRSDDGRAVARHEVRIVLQPKGSNPR